MIGLLVWNDVILYIFSIFSTLDSNMLVRIYKSMVRPILEYANTICGPHYLMDQRKVEAIQHRATKLITSLCESDYNTRIAIAFTYLSTSTWWYDF